MTAVIRWIGREMHCGEKVAGPTAATTERIALSQAAALARWTALPTSRSAFRSFDATGRENVARASSWIFTVSAPLE